MKVTKATNGCNTILIVVDQFMKYGQFIPTKQTATAVGIVQRYIDQVAWSVGYPQHIISDCDIKFTSQV